MSEVHRILSPPASLELLWQTDGRPMSGDVGRGMAHAAVAFAERALAAKEAHGIPGHVQLAGGTNDFTAELVMTMMLTMLTLMMLMECWLERVVTTGQKPSQHASTHTSRDTLAGLACAFIPCTGWRAVRGYCGSGLRGIREEDTTADIRRAFDQVRPPHGPAHAGWLAG